MRRLVFASMICAVILPGLALAQTASPPPGSPVPPGPAMAPPDGLPDGPGGQHHWHHDDKRMHDKFSAANTSHDGHLTLAQAKAADLRPVVDHFSEIDTAHRGYVTINEVQAWHMDEMAKHLEARAAQLRAQD